MCVVFSSYSRPTTLSTGMRKFTPFAPRSCHHILGILDSVRLAKRVADRYSHRGKKRIRHAAADDQRIHLIHQVVDDADLIGNLGAAENGDERTLRIFQSAAPITLISF